MIVYSKPHHQAGSLHSSDHTADVQNLGFKCAHSGLLPVRSLYL